MGDFLIFLFIFMILIILSIIDIKSKTIPAIGCILILLTGGIKMFMDGEILFHANGFVFMLAINVILAVTTRGIGGGDIKLFSALGFLYGINKSLEIYILSFIFSGVFIVGAIIYRRVCKNAKYFSQFNEIPFVPFIAAANFIGAFI